MYCLVQVTLSVVLSKCLDGKHFELYPQLHMTLSPQCSGCEVITPDSHPNLIVREVGGQPPTEYFVGAVGHDCGHNTRDVFSN